MPSFSPVGATMMGVSDSAPLADANLAPADLALGHLESSLAWYDRHARQSHRLFKGFKIVSLLAAAAIPFLSGFAGQLLGGSENAAFVVGFLGALIVVVESFQQLFQWEQHWLNYRRTWQALNREKYLYLSLAGPYADAEVPHRLLAERVELLIDQEAAKWVSLHEERAHKDSGRATSEPR